MRQGAGSQKARSGSAFFPDPGSGVSEVIGSFLLISIVVLAIAIIAALLFSQTLPQQVPDVNFMVGTDSNNPPTLYLYHNGGDSLNTSDFTVLVNGVSYKPSIAGGVWSLGGNLRITLPSGVVPTSIALVYNKTGSNAVVLRSASANVSSISGNIRPEILAGLSYPPVIDVSQLTQNVTNRSVVFFREKNTTLSQNSYLTFNITRPNSSISTSPLCSGSNPFYLNVGDVVTVTQADTVSQGFRIAGTGDQLFELNADRATVSIASSTGTSRCSLTGAIINHTLVTGYTNMRSTLTVSTSGGNYFTALVINNYSSAYTPLVTQQYITRLSSDAIVLNNIAPTSSGFFVFQLDNTTKSAYIVGVPTAVTNNSIQIYP